MRGFDGLGQLALRLTDPRLQSVNLVGFGLKERSDEIVIRNQGVMPAGGDDGLEVIADLLPPVHKHPGAFELVEDVQGNELAFECGQQLMTDVRHLFTVTQSGKVVAGHPPPGLQGVVVCGKSLTEGGVGFEYGLDGGLSENAELGLGVPSAESEVAGPPGLEERIGPYAEARKVGRTGADLGLGDAADQMRLHILRFRVGGVVHITADVEIVIVCAHDLGLVHQSAVFGNFPLVGEDEVDLFDVLGAQFVLGLAFGVFAVGIDEEHLVLEGLGLVLVGHDHAGGDAGAVEEAGRQADDGLDHIVVDEDLTDQFFLAAAEQHAVGHDGGHVAVRLQAGQHVLHEHQVGLFAGLGAPFAETAGEFQRGAAVVLREGWIGQDPVELADLSVFQDQRVLQGISVFDGEAGNVVEDHVHVADRPDGAVGVLAIEGEVVGVLALLLHILVGLDGEAAGADGGIVDRVARLGLGDLHQQAHHFGGRVELAAFFARAVGKELDQVFVGRPQKVGKLEVVVDQHEPGLVEVIQQILPLLVGDLGLAFDGVEIDVVFEHPGQGVVFLFDGGDGLVEHVADVVLEVLQCRDKLAVRVDPGFMPAGTDRNEEGLAVGGLVFQQLRDETGLVLQMGEISLAQLLALAVEFVGEALEEKHPEDEFLEFRGVHLAPQDIGGFE